MSLYPNLFFQDTIEMFNIGEILYGTLDTFAKVYGLKVVIKVCQQFIIDSIKEEEERASANVVVSAPVAKKPE